MTKLSAGLLMYRRDAEGGIELLVAHPGGPFFRKRHDGAWSIPKGLVEDGEDLRVAAVREFTEETGFPVSDPDLLDLGVVIQKGGKRVHAFGAAGDPDLATFRSNAFELEWPPRSGRTQSFPEIDAVRFVTADEASRLLMPAQVPFVERLLEALGET